MMRKLLILLAVFVGCGKEEKPIEPQTKTIEKIVRVSSNLNDNEKNAITVWYFLQLKHSTENQKQILDNWNELRDNVKRNPDSRTIAAQYVTAFDKGKREFDRLQELIESDAIMYRARLDELGIDSKTLQMPPEVTYGVSFAKTALELKAKFKL